MIGKVKNIYKRYKSSRNVKTLASNFMWLSVLQAASYAFPLITMPYMARIVGSSGLGSIAFAAAVMVWVTTVSDWGFYLSSVRDVSLKRDEKKQVDRIFSEVILAKVLLIFSCVLVLGILMIFIEKFRENALILFYTFLLIPGRVMEVDWLYQGLQRMRVIALLNLLTRTIFTISVFVFIKEPDDYLYQPLLMSLGTLLSGVISLYIIFVKYKIKFVKVSLKDVLKRIKSSTDIFINTLLPNLYNSFSIILLGFWGGAVYNGLYDAGHKLVQISNNMFTMLSRTFFPFLSRRIDKHDAYRKISLTMAIACAVFLFVFAPLLIKIFFGPKFASAVIILRIQAVAVVFFTISDIYGKNYLIVTHRERILRNITGICSVIGFVAAFPLVYFLKDVGVAITVVLSLAMISLSSMYFAKRFIKEDKEKGNAN